MKIRFIIVFVLTTFSQNVFSASSKDILLKSKDFQATYFLGQKSHTLEICPDNVCELIIGPKNMPSDDFFNFAVLYLFDNNKDQTNYSNPEKIVSTVKDQALLLEKQNSFKCLDMKCILKKFREIHSIETGGVKYDEGERCTFDIKNSGCHKGKCKRLGSTLSCTYDHLKH